MQAGMKRQAVRGCIFGAAGCALIACAGPSQGGEWRGPGWYQVLAIGAVSRIEAGPYKTELACKKAMNSARADRSCRELEAPLPRN